MLLPLFFILSHVIGFLNIGSVRTLDNIIYDAKLRSVMPSTRDSRIVVVDLDEKSLAEVGQWPWSRDKLALLTRELFENQKISTLGFDVVFAESGNSNAVPYLKHIAKNEACSDPVFLEHLQKSGGVLNLDAQFAESLKNQSVVLGYYFTSDRRAHKSGELPAPVITKQDINNLALRATVWDGYGSNIKQLASSVSHAGFFNAIADEDGVVRSVPLLGRYNNDYYESFPLALYCAYLGWPKISPIYSVNFRTANLKALKIDHKTKLQTAQTIKVDSRASILVPYRGVGGGDGGTFQYISASDVLYKRLPKEFLLGKIVLIGSSTPGLQDLRSTPVGQAYPGVEVHANVLSSMLDGKSIYVPDYALGVEFALLMLVGFTLAFILPVLPAIHALGLSLACLLIPLALNMHWFNEYGAVIPIASLILLSVFAYGLNMSHGFFLESKAKRELTQLFGSYVPPQLVDELMLEPSNHTMKASTKDLTVMFCDLRGFTQLADSLEPVQVQHMLNDVFGRLTKLIIERRGTIDKYMGDSVMAFWGAPIAIENHAELAVLAALDITSSVAEINNEHLSMGLPGVKLGIGINTGLMCVGDMGSFMRRSYTVVGDAVNIAARLESMTKKYEVPILVGSKTKLDAAKFTWKEVDQVQIIGKQSPLTIFTPKLPNSST